MSLISTATLRRRQTNVWGAQMSHRVGHVDHLVNDDGHTAAFTISVELRDVAPTGPALPVTVLFSCYDTTKKAFRGPTCEILRTPGKNVDALLLVPASRADDFVVAVQLVRLEDDASEGWCSAPLKQCGHTPLTLLTQGPQLLRTSRAALSHPSPAIHVGVTIVNEGKSVTELAKQVPKFAFVRRDQLPPPLLAAAGAKDVKEVTLSGLQLELPNAVQTHISAMESGNGRTPAYTIKCFLHNGYGFLAAPYMRTGRSWAVHLTPSPEVAIVVILQVRVSTASEEMLPVAWTAVFPFSDLYVHDRGSIYVQMSTAMTRVCGEDVGSKLTTVFRRDNRYGLSFRLDIPGMRQSEESKVARALHPPARKPSSATETTVSTSSSHTTVDAPRKPPKAPRRPSAGTAAVRELEPENLGATTRSMVMASPTPNAGPGSRYTAPTPAGGMSPALFHAQDEGKLDHLLKTMESLRTEVEEIRQDIHGPTNIASSMMMGVSPHGPAVVANSQLRDTRVSLMDSVRMSTRRRVLHRFKDNALSQSSQAILNPLNGSVVSAKPLPSASMSMTLRGAPASQMMDASVLQVRFRGVSFLQAEDKSCTSSSSYATLSLSFPYCDHNVTLADIKLNEVPAEVPDGFDTFSLCGETSVWTEPWPGEVQHATYTPKLMKARMKEYSHIKASGAIVVNISDTFGAVIGYTVVNVADAARTGTSMLEMDCALVDHDGWVGYGCTDRILGYLHVTVAVSPGDDVWDAYRQQHSLGDVPTDRPSASSAVVKSILKHAESKVTRVTRLPVARMSATIDAPLPIKKDEDRAATTSSTAGMSVHDRRVQWAKENLIVPPPQRASTSSKKKHSGSSSSLAAVDPVLLEQRMKEVQSMREIQKRDIIARKILSHHHTNLDVVATFGKPEYFTLPFANPFDVESRFTVVIEDPGCGTDRGKPEIHEELVLIDELTHWHGRTPTASIPFEAINGSQLLLHPHEGIELPFRLHCTGAGHYHATTVFEPREVKVFLMTKSDNIKTFVVNVSMAPCPVERTVHLSHLSDDSTELWARVDDFTLAVPFADFHVDATRQEAIAKKCKAIVVHPSDGSCGFTVGTRYVESLLSGPTASVSAQVSEYLVVTPTASCPSSAAMEALVLFYDGPQHAAFWKAWRIVVTRYSRVVLAPWPLGVPVHRDIELTSPCHSSSDYRVVQVLPPGSGLCVKHNGRGGVGIDAIALAENANHSLTLVTKSDRVVATWTTEEGASSRILHTLATVAGRALVHEVRHTNTRAAATSVLCRIGADPGEATVQPQCATVVEAGSTVVFRVHIAGPAETAASQQLSWLMWVTECLSNDEERVLETYQIQVNVSPSK